MAIALIAAGGTMETAHAATPTVRPFAGFTAPGVVPLTHGHSHNDYERRHPLFDALSRGFTSIEVDVVLVGGRLLVGHDPVQALVRGATLRSLYLDPLADWVARNGGSVFSAGGPALTLLVDVKSEARSTWHALEGVLADYEDMLTRFTRDGVQLGAVTVIVSGNRAPGLLAEDSARFTALDGRADDLAGPNPVQAALMPMVSVRWGDLFRWRGTGAMPAAELATMQALVEAAHAQGRRIRFFDTPDRTAADRANVWQAELAAGVDLLNVDDLAMGQAFLLEQQREQDRAQT
jgi:glycerophosphoryl diester phosphodiesterase